MDRYLCHSIITSLNLVYIIRDVYEILFDRYKYVVDDSPLGKKK